MTASTPHTPADTPDATPGDVDYDAINMMDRGRIGEDQRLDAIADALGKWVTVYVGGRTGFYYVGKFLRELHKAGYEVTALPGTPGEEQPRGESPDQTGDTARTSPPPAVFRAGH